MFETAVLGLVSSDTPMFWLLGPVAGVGFYSMIYLRYRNTNKRHKYEYETVSEMTDVRAGDRKVNKIRGTRNRHTQGANSKSPTTRLGRGTQITEVKTPKADTGGDTPVE